MRASLVPLAPLVAIVLAQFACGGRVDGVSSSGSPSSEPGSSTEPTPGSSGSSSGGGGTTGNGPGSARPSDPAETCELACDEGHQDVQGTIACGPNSACYTRTACGKTITCTGPKGLCEDPECLGYTQEVDACPAGSNCTVQRLCEKTMICEAVDAQCDGVPACDEEDETVASAAECAKYGERCYSRAECGGRMYCVRAL